MTGERNRKDVSHQNYRVQKSLLEEVFRYIDARSHFRLAVPSELVDVFLRRHARCIVASIKRFAVATPRALGQRLRLSDRLGAS